MNLSLRADLNRYKDAAEILHARTKEDEKKISDYENTINRIGKELFETRNELTEAQNIIHLQKTTITRSENQLNL